MGSADGRGAGTQLLDRAFDIINLLAESASGMSVKELADAADLPASTAYRIIQALENRGHVLRLSGRVLLGPASAALSREFSGRVLQDLLEDAHSILQDLASFAGDTATLSVANGSRGLLVSRQDARHSPFTSIVMGGNFSLTAGGMGKVMLAFTDATIQKSAIAAAEGSKYSNGTRVRSDLLYREIRQVRTQGFHWSSEEVQVGTMGVSSPIRNAARAIGSVSIIMPYQPIPHRRLDELTDATTHAAHDIEDRWRRM